MKAAVLALLVCTAVSLPGAARAQHMLTDRTRDVSLGRAGLRSVRDPEQGLTLETRVDWGTRALHLFDVVDPAGDETAPDNLRGKQVHVYRHDITGIYSWHPWLGGWWFDFHLGFLASYTHAGSGPTAEDTDDDRSGNIEVRPFLLIPLLVGELIFSAGGSWSAGKACSGGSQVRNDDDSRRCNNTLKMRSHAAVARPVDAANLLPQANVQRYALSWNLDLGFFALRLDGGVDRIEWRRKALDTGHYMGHLATGLSISTTSASVLVDYAYLVTGPRGIFHSVDRSVDSVGFPGHKTPGDRARSVNILAVGLRYIWGRHLQTTVSLTVLEALFLGGTLEVPF